MKLPNKNEIRKPTRTLAGVTPIAVMLCPRKCKHGTCIYCPSLDVPQSYTPLSPATIRAKMLNYNPKEQVKARLKAFSLMNHPNDKIELIIMGGTFLEYPKKYQENFVKECYNALNEKTSKTLEQAKKLNETAKHRCVALCIETRPDVCGKKEIKQLLKFGCTRVELGVQILDDDIYKKIKRGHKIKQVIESTSLLKNSGFKVGYHIMPGLPFSNPKKDLELFEKIFKDENFKPDQLKIYPCQVIKGSALEKIYKNGKFTPYPEKVISSLIIKMLKKIPPYCRVMRIMREIPPVFMVAGTKRIDLRKDIDLYVKNNKIQLQEIRQREIGFAMRDLKKGEVINKDLKLKITKYDSSKGKEYFLEIINKNNILFGLLRLRFPFKPFLRELKNSAIIRELHVYGKAENLGKKSKESFQHRGLGKFLISEAEKIVKENSKKYNLNKISIISGVGVREYYKKLGYELGKDYMNKKIKK